MTRVLALDLAKLTGWAVGSQAGVEGFGVHEFPSTGENVGEYGMAARITFRRMLAEVEPDEAIYEAPILRPGTAKINGKGRAYLEIRDTPQKLQKIYGLPWEFQIECHRAGIKVQEADMGRIRRHFLFGKVPRTTVEIKLAVKVMARMRGWAVRDDNEADALATLDYQLAVIDPSWAAKLAVLRIGAGPSGRLSSSGADVFAGSRQFFPPATKTGAPAELKSSSAGAAAASSTGRASPGKTTATTRRSGAAMSSTSSASRAKPPLRVPEAWKPPVWKR